MDKSIGTIDPFSLSVQNEYIFIKVNKSVANLYTCIYRNQYANLINIIQQMMYSWNKIEYLLINGSKNCFIHKKEHTQWELNFQKMSVINVCKLFSRCVSSA